MTEPVVPLPYPKDDGTLRETCLLDPFDDLSYSLLASDLAPHVERALPPDDVVLSTRFRLHSSNVYFAEDWRDAQKRRGRAFKRVGLRQTGGFDVERHFPTLQTATLDAVLNSCMVPSALIENFVTLLAGFTRWPSAPSGLPAGPMGSALVGTVALLPVDRLLARLSVPYERWVDDFVVVCHDRSQFDTLLSDVDSQLATSGQRLNQAKSWFQDFMPGHASLVDSALDDGTDADPLSTTDLEAAVEKGDGRRCRFILGGLRSRDDPRAVHFVAHNRDLWKLAPKRAADYLIRCKHDLVEDEITTIADLCTAPPSDTTAAGIAHAGRVLGVRRVRASLGPCLHEAADRASTSRFRAISPMLYRAGAVSKEKSTLRHERSLETAAVLRELNSQRGLLAGLRVDTPARSIASGLSALGRVAPDLQPTLTWIQAHQRL